MPNEHTRNTLYDNQTGAAGKRFNSECMEIPVKITAPAQATIYFASLDSHDIYASGANFPGDIPFGD